MGSKFLHMLFATILILTFGNIVSAEKADNFNDQMIEKTKEAANVQLSLSERGYTYSEVIEALTPYFTDQFIDAFISVNMMKEDDGLYYIMGTDFPIYYIPFYQYAGETIVEMSDDYTQVVVYEFFSATSDGPIGYDDHYEAILYKLENDEWKVDEIIPQYNPNEARANSKEELSTMATSERSDQIVDMDEEETTVEEVEETKTMVEKGLGVLRAIASFFSSYFGKV